MWAAYGWTPAQTGDMTPRQLAYAIKQLPVVEARTHYGVAQLTADFREMFFPRYTEPDPDEKQSTKPPRARKNWTVEELLPPFAYFNREEMTPGQAESLAAAFEDLPEWCKTIAPISEARALLN